MAKKKPGEIDFPKIQKKCSCLFAFFSAPQAPKKYYVYNDIFRYQDEVFDDSDTDPSISMATDNMDNSFENVENEKNNHRNDGIATVSILDGVQKPSGGGGSEIHVNGGK